MKRTITVVAVAMFLTTLLFLSSRAIGSSLKCSSLTGCGDWLQCPDRGFELQACVLDCDSGHIVFCPGNPGGK